MNPDPDLNGQTPPELLEDQENNKKGKKKKKKKKKKKSVSGSGPEAKLKLFK